jgi:hypothetical protein
MECYTDSSRECEHPLGFFNSTWLPSLEAGLVSKLRKVCFPELGWPGGGGVVVVQGPCLLSPLQPRRATLATTSRV